MIEDTGIVIAFWILAIMTVANALMVVAARTLLHAVLFLVLSFIGMAGLFITLSADFVAAVQILVYVGAVAVLMVFAIMLTRENWNNEYALPALALAVLLGTALTFAALDTGWPTPPGALPAVPATAAAIGDALLDPFVLPFEIASVVLVVAMVGAIALVREED